MLLMKVARNPVNTFDRGPTLSLRNRLATFAWSGVGLYF